MEAFMRLKHQDDVLLLDLIGNGINSVEFDIHLRTIKTLKEFSRVYVDIKNLACMDNAVLAEFRKMKMLLFDKAVSFINVNPMQNVILNLFGLDKLFQIYINKEDAFEAQKPVVNRKFRVV